MIEIKSNDKKNMIIYVGTLLVGLLIVYLTSKSEPMNNNTQAAYVLGLLLAALGGFCMVYQQSYNSKVDPVQKNLVHISKNAAFGTIKKIIPFSEISRTAVYYIGDYDSRSFHLKFILKNNEELQTGRWSSDEREIKLLAEKIAQTIGCSHPDVPVETNISHEIENAFFAAAISFSLYAIYYSTRVGPMCPAMWFGTFPSFFILIGWLCSYQIIRRLRKQYAK